jgi:hypothetical protein
VLQDSRQVEVSPVKAVRLLSVLESLEAEAMD